MKCKTIHNILRNVFETWNKLAQALFIPQRGKATLLPGVFAQVTCTSPARVKTHQMEPSAYLGSWDTHHSAAELSWAVRNRSDRIEKDS